MTDDERQPLPLIPPYLIKRVGQGKVVPFIGAGISMGVKLLMNEQRNNKWGRMPSYKELLLDLVEQADREGLFSLHPSKQSEAMKLIAAGKMMDAADTLEVPIDKSSRYKFLRRILNHLSAEPSLVHELLNILDFPLILTSNYDRLLEDALYPTPEVLTHQDATAIKGLLEEEEGERFVFKVHGDVTRPETIVLGYSAYRDLHSSVKEGDTALRLALTSIFSQKTLLFLGCSMAGGEYTEYFSKLFKAFSGNTGTHFAFLPQGAITAKQEKKWKYDFGVHMIPYVPDRTFSHVWEFLSQLKMKQKPLPRPGEIWSDFFTPGRRPDYLRLQLRQEKIASSIRYITPSLTNALAHDDYIRFDCGKKLGKFRRHVDDFDKFSSDTLKTMLDRAHNLEEGISSKKLDVRAVFLKETLDQELQGATPEVRQRFCHVVRMVEQNPLNVGVRAFAGNVSREDFERYSFALIFTPAPSLPDITCAYASQATTNDYQTHIILVNTKQVTFRCEKFEKFWAASMDERATIEMIKQRLAATGVSE